MPGTTTQFRNALAVAVAIPALFLGLSACSGTSPVPEAGSTGGSGTSSEADAHFAWELKFTQCLRDNGIDIKDPDPVTGVEQPPLTDEFRAAMKSCEAEVGSPPGANKTPEQLEEIHQNYLKEAQCFRDNGIDVKDPTRDQAITMPDVDIPDEVYEKCLPADPAGE